LTKLQTVKGGNFFETQCILGVPKFHPNPFTSGGVIAERVNAVQTHHKVFPILGEAIASSPSNKDVAVPE